METLGSRLNRLPLWQLGCLVALALVVKHGVWLAPNVADLLAIARNPYEVSLPPSAQWKYYSLLYPLLYHHAAGGADDTLWFGTFALLLFIGGMCVAFWRIAVRDGADLVRVLLAVVVATPATAAAMTWLGYADTLSLPLMLIAFAFRTPLVSAVCGVLLGLNHAELGFVAVGAAAVAAWKLNEKTLLKLCLILLAAIVAGRLVLVAHLAYHDMQLSLSRFSYFGDRGWKVFAVTLLYNPDVLAFSLLGPLWLLVPLLWLPQLAGLRGALLTAVAVLALPTLASLDRTRIFAVGLWPSLLLAVLVARDAWICRRDLVVGLAAVSLLVPTFFVWAGRVYATSLARVLESLPNCIEKGFVACEWRVFSGWW